MIEEEEEQKEGYGTSIEKYIRDKILWPVTWLFGFVPHSANILTISRFFITFWAILDFIFYHNSIERQIWFLIIGWVTDFLDGSTARNNKTITAFGTIADYVADFLLTLWMVFLCFHVTVRLERLAAVLIYTVLSLTVAGMILIVVGMWLLKKAKQAERPEQSYLDFIQEFALKDLITTINARFHTGLTAFGAIFFLTGVIWNKESYFFIGGTLLLVQLVSLGFYLYEIFQARYEDRTYKIRRALEKKIQDLEERFKKRKDSYPA